MKRPCLSERRQVAGTCRSGPASRGSAPAASWPRCDDARARLCADPATLTHSTQSQRLGVAAQFGVTANEIQAYRTRMYEAFKLDMLECPPPRTVWLRRGRDVDLRPYALDVSRGRQPWMVG